VSYTTIVFCLFVVMIKIIQIAYTTMVINMIKFYNKHTCAK